MSARFSARRLAALLGKELHALFAQPLLWIVGVFFLLLSGYYFWSDLAFFVTFGFGENIFENFFQLLFVDLRLVLILTVPLLTMRAFAEERKLGTIELLLTYPLSDLEIYLAKLLACAAATLCLLGATALPLVYLYHLQPFPIGPVLVGYAGLGLMALCFVAVGLAFSCATDSQVVAAMSTAGTLVLLWVLSWSDTSAEGGPATWLSRLSIFEHFESFTRGVVETRDVAYFGCLIVLASAVALAILGSRSWRGRRRLATIVGLAGLLVALGFAAALGERHNLRFDATPQKLFTLSPHARRILARLPGDVELVAFLRSGDPANAGRLDLLGRIAEASPRVRYRAVDVNRNPAMARRYGVDAYGAIVVDSGGRSRVLNAAREDLLVGAMLELTRPKPLVVGFARPQVSRPPAQGPRGESFSTLRGTLRDEGVEVRDVSLGERVAADVSALVVVAGDEPWAPAEIATLGAWIGGGGRALVLIEPQAGPWLASWLSGMGMTPRKDVVLDPDNRLHGGEEVSIEATVPSEQPAAAADGGSARAISQSLDHGVLLSAARSLELGRGVAALLESSAASWATEDLERAERGFASFDGARDRRGPLAVAAAREWRAMGSPRASRMVVVGDADLASDGFVDYLANRDFLHNAIRWLVGDEDLIALRPRRKELGRQQLFLSAGQARLALLLAVGILPGASALVAAALLLRRRLTR